MNSRFAKITLFFPKYKVSCCNFVLSCFNQCIVEWNIFFKNHWQLFNKRHGPENSRLHTPSIKKICPLIIVIIHVLLKKRAARIILDCYFSVHSFVLFFKLRWMTFPECVIYQKAIQMFQTIHTRWSTRLLANIFHFLLGRTYQTVTVIIYIWIIRP